LRILNTCTCNENKWHRSALDLARLIGDDETAKLLETHAAEHLADDFTWYEEWYHVLKHRVPKQLLLYHINRAVEPSGH
jgi:hypothetical protein